jgi:asparagine synthase (glutamine-hydrolysing)
MCGIAGVVEFGDDARVDAAVVRRMCQAIVHRGPDDEGVYVEGAVGLGMRRLSIIDVKAGHQPITNEDQSIWLVYNGEIYNHLALREELVRKGHVFRTHCDTETIVHAYEEYGRDCVLRLRGMFAFALWDAPRRRLFAARDRLGIKPFYYRHAESSFLFGSEIKAILAYPGERAEFNPSILPEYLAFGYLSGSDTFFSGINKLMPGHTLQLDDTGALTLEPYWDLAPSADEPPRPESYYVQGYRDRIEQAVSSHLMSDVPLGVFLSGGLDSSAVAALATRIRRTPVETFSVGYAEQVYSELSYARQVAAHLNSIHHEVQVSCQDFFDALPKLIWHEDEPITWPSSVSLYFVAQLAREHATVVLTGEGADETLAGYTRYAFTLKNAAFDRAYRGLTPRRLRNAIRRFISDSSALSASWRRKLEHTFLAREGECWSSFYFDNFFSAFSASEQSQLLADDRAGGLSKATYGHVLDYWDHSAGPLLQRLLYTDIKTYLVELLMKQDNMSMAASIESRVPFLDHELVEFAMGIPAGLQLNGLSGKRVLKKAMEDLLPHSIIYRPKLGFPTPWSHWIGGPQLDAVETLLTEPRSCNRGIFRPGAVQRLFREQRARHRDNCDRIWRLLNLELWFRVMIEGDPHDAGWSLVAGEANASSRDAGGLPNRLP